MSIETVTLNTKNALIQLQTWRHRGTGIHTTRMCPARRSHRHPECRRRTGATGRRAGLKAIAKAMAWRKPKSSRIRTSLRRD